LAGQITVSERVLKVLKALLGKSGDSCRGSNEADLVFYTGRGLCGI
jgi:hypothetical protein